MVELEHFDAGQRLVQRLGAAVFVGHLLDLLNLKLVGDQTVRQEHEHHHTDAGDRGQAELSPYQECADYNLQGATPGLVDDEQIIQDFLRVQRHQIHDFAGCEVLESWEKNKKH